MAWSMKKAVIFDLDGTLSDSIASLKYCGDRALAPFGYGPFPESDYKYFVGDGAANLVKRALIKAGDEKLAHFEEAFALYKDYFAADCMYQVKPYDGIPELLTALKERGLKTAVLSNKPHLQTLEVIHTLFGRDCFDLIWGQRDGLPIKPDPAGVFAILDKLNLGAEEILYLGDTATDMKTGKSAGAFTIGALWGFRDRQELEEGGADALIAHPPELLEYV
ncbi:MAG: HAD family hydrolase [bacterium]|nr:HAD family hydrolase [bacterium]